MAMDFGVSPQTLAKRMREYGISYRRERIPAKELRRLVSKNMSGAEIADRFGVSQSTVKR